MPESSLSMLLERTSALTLTSCWMPASDAMRLLLAISARISVIRSSPLSISTSLNPMLSILIPFMRRKGLRSETLLFLIDSHASPWQPRMLSMAVSLLPPMSSRFRLVHTLRSGSVSKSMLLMFRTSASIGSPFIFSAIAAKLDASLCLLEPKDSAPGLSLLECSLSSPAAFGFTVTSGFRLFFSFFRSWMMLLAGCLSTTFSSPSLPSSLCVIFC
mmetsp:Transcript_55905/g.131638  ORF Transcript_55905/g.131638 Transcript_55905/m.131638 type:complete len:216 (-) Transcript_55905:73-720(-)